MTLIDAFFRFSGIGILVLLAIVTLRDFRRWRSTPYLILSCLSVSALFLGYAPDALRPRGMSYQIIRILDVPHLVFVWLFALSLFDTNFRLQWKHWVGGVTYCLPILWLRLTPPSEFQFLLIYLVSFLSLLLMVHLCFKTLKGLRDDLSDKRRKSRVYFVFLIVAVTVIAAVSETFVIKPSSLSDYTVKVLSLWPAIIWGAYWMLSFNHTSVLFGNSADNIELKVSQLDQSLLSRLSAEMEGNEAFKQSEITIVSLANRLGVTQHRLRSFINQNLGYPNFSAFVNGYRMNAVKLALRDDKQQDKSILSIALDAGFKSLSSFNRVFKLSEGLTPSDYRNFCKSN